MRKSVLFVLLIFTILAVCGCGKKNSNIKVYEDTEEKSVSHIEQSFTAVVTDVNLADKYICFIDTNTGEMRSLEYHGGVGVYNTHDRETVINDITCGSVVDAVFYADTNKLVSISMNKQATTISHVNKFSVDLQELKARYKGTSCNLWNHVVAFDDGKMINAMEVNPEDQVTLTMYNNKLVSIVVDIGHGYVRLMNQDTYVGGMVEIGYDVIVPVGRDMLLAVREGNYTLRINKGSFSNSKQVTVSKDEEVVVDISDIAIPTGTAVFSITPADAKLYVSGELQSTHAYTSLYGSYKYKIEAEGYKTKKGSYKLNDTIKKIEITLEADETATTESTTTEGATTSVPGSTSAPGTTGTPGSTTAPTTSDGTTGASTTETNPTESTDATTEDDKPGPATENDIGTTEAPQATDNKVTIKAPIGASVYLDGEYVGVAPVSFPKTIGTHTIILHQKGYLIKSYTINLIDNGKDDEYSFPPLSSLIELIE